MFNIVLHQPEIPPNTGNVIRLASNAGCRLHLIEPLGFVLDDKRLRRAGLDYHEYSELRVHADWEALLQEAGDARIVAFSTRGETYHGDFAFREGDFLLFGAETRGLPAELLRSSRLAAVLRLPMRAQSRSLNLSNTVAVAVYEAWRQLGYPGGR